MKKLLFTLLFPLLVFSQEIKNNLINPFDKWYIGGEIGTNTITSFDFGSNKSFQGGVLVEYYTGRNWSLSARIKYFKTGVLNKVNSSIGIFNGAVISMPLNIKWEYRVWKNFRGNLKLGVALNKEIKSNYNYPLNESTNYAAFYGTFNPGFGLNYFFSNKTAIYIDYEVYVLGNNRDEGWVIILPNSPNNNLFNLGIKYNLKK